MGRAPGTAPGDVEASTPSPGPRSGATGASVAGTGHLNGSGRPGPVMGRTPPTDGTFAPTTDCNAHDHWSQQMRILVNTPTGRVGGQVARHLLDAGLDLTLVARHPQKLEGLGTRAPVVQGALEDPAVLDRATQGVDTMFWVTPSLANPDYLRWAHDLAKLAVATARRNGVKRAVMLSSISAQVPGGVGPISSLHRVEREFQAGFPDLVILRPTFFMENHLGSLASIGSMGAIFAPITGHVRFPQIATRDIAARAAALLGEGTWTGQRILGLHGPADLDYESTARIVGEALGRPVRFIQVTADQARQSMRESGLPDYVADAYVEMYSAMGSGVFQQAEPRTPDTTTPTTLRQFALDTIKPAVEAAAQAGAKA